MTKQEKIKIIENEIRDYNIHIWDVEKYMDIKIPDVKRQAIEKKEYYTMMLNIFLKELDTLKGKK